MTDTHPSGAARRGNIAELGTAHLTSMLDLFAQGQRPHHESHPEHFGPGDNTEAIEAYLKGFLKGRNPLRKRTGFAKGWFVDGVLCGYLLYRLELREDVFYGRARWSCFVEDIVIDKNERASGAASALIELMLAEAESRGDCVFGATVWSGNEASARLFERHGFRAQSQTFYKVSQ
ncbi:MAG: GNAT family N-acetyltransferase [Erythrobacter sp.]